MSKKSKKNTENKLVRSINKNIRSSTKKLNPILKNIVGKKVDIAIRDLTFSDKRISIDIKKTISSAIANAENNFQYNIDNLFVKEAYCGKQIIMKRHQKETHFLIDQPNSLLCSHVLTNHQYRQ